MANRTKFIRIKIQDDGRILEVPSDVARVSGFIRNSHPSVLMNAKTKGEKSKAADKDDDLLIVQDFSYEIMKKVFEWCEYHKNEPEVLCERDLPMRTDDIPEWDRRFFDTDKSTLFTMIKAANMFDVNGMLVNGSKTLANMLKRRNTDQNTVQPRSSSKESE